MLRGFASLAALGSALGNQYDVFYPQYSAPSACLEGCARWSDVAADGVTGITQQQVVHFANGSVLNGGLCVAGGYQCAQLGDCESRKTGCGKQRI